MNGLTRLSPLALTILAMLYETPLHPYRMQQLIKERGKDEVVNVRQRASLYQAIERLLREGLIEIREASREENRPERTVYALTQRGYEVALAWMRHVLSTPAREFPIFPAALAEVALLTPEDVLVALAAREQALVAEVARLDAGMRQAPDLPRHFLLEGEYTRAVREVELRWVRALIADLREGRLTWTEEGVRALGEGVNGGGDTEGDG